MNKRANPEFDVLGLGCAAVDDLLYVSSFPAPDGKRRVEATARKFGGLTGAALVAVARLGADCAYAGCLGEDDFSRCVEQNFRQEGIDVSLAPRVPEARVVHSTIVVGRDTGSRNIFFEDSGLIGAHDSLPAEEIITGSRVLFVDHLGMPGNRRAARLARAAGIPVVADLEDASHPLFPEVLGLVDHLILSEEFALAITGKLDAEAAARALWTSDRAAVLVTGGARGCWSVSRTAPGIPLHHPAFNVKAVDTTGCGDVFHGAYAAGLAQGMDLETRIRFAAAAAALKAARGEIPRRTDVDAFLNS